MTEQASLEEVVCCVNQVFRPKYHWLFLQKPGWGDCTVCSYDPVNNPRCRGYAPVRYVTITVRDDEKKDQARLYP
jgi:hypothetical protein